MSIESSNPILNIGELAKPATVLIEKVSDAMGCLYEPTKIKRLASAESEAARIISESHIQISDLERRAAQRRRRTLSTGASLSISARLSQTEVSNFFFSHSSSILSRPICS